MKGGGSRLNVNTDKPHSLISIKNKVLPTSPPARQSPQAPPTATRARRPGEREREPLAAPRCLPWAAPLRRPPRPDTSRHASGTPSVNTPGARADPRPHTPWKRTLPESSALLAARRIRDVITVDYFPCLCRVSVVIRGLLCANTNRR